MKSRDYSSSVPIRYIPKKSSKINKLENSQPPKSSKKKQDCNFSDASALRNDIRHGGIGSGTGELKKDFNFDKEPQYKRMPATDSLFSGSEQGILYFQTQLLKPYLIMVAAKYNDVLLCGFACQ